MSNDALYPFVAATRTYPLGSDIGGSSTLDYALTVNTGRRSLADRILRRLTTPRGGLFYAPAYGYNLQDCVGSSVPTGIVEQRTLEQVMSEEEVEDAECTATFDDSTGALGVAINVVDAEGPFELVITAAELTLSALIDGVELFNEAA